MSLAQVIHQKSDIPILEKLADEFVFRVQDINNSQVNGWVNEYSPNITFVKKLYLSPVFCSNNTALFYSAFIENYGRNNERVIKEDKLENLYLTKLRDRPNTRIQENIYAGERDVLDFFDVFLSYILYYSYSECSQKRRLMLFNKSELEAIGFSIELPHPCELINFPEERKVMSAGRLTNLPLDGAITFHLPGGFEGAITAEEREIISDDSLYFGTRGNSIVGLRSYSETYRQLIEFGTSLT